MRCLPTSPSSFLSLAIQVNNNVANERNHVKLGKQNNTSAAVAVERGVDTSKHNHRNNLLKVDSSTITVNGGGNQSEEEEMVVTLGTMAMSSERSQQDTGKLPSCRDSVPGGYLVRKSYSTTHTL